MPIINETKIEILREKVDAWREVEQESVGRYCEILDLMGQLSDQVNGHPEEAVFILKSLKDEIGKISAGMSKKNLEKTRTPWWTHPVVMTLSFVGVTVFSCLLTLILTGQTIFWPY